MRVTLNRLLFFFLIIGLGACSEDPGTSDSGAGQTAESPYAAGNFAASPQNAASLGTVGGVPETPGSETSEDETCVPDCTDKVCGDDGCGNPCGACDGSFVCSDKGICVDPSCTPKCEGKECGDDGCGGLCGVCETGITCLDNGQCGTCTPECNGKACGDDGCGGSCGECALGSSCSPQGQCLCTPNCAGKECGDNGCGGLCGTCPGGEFCTTQNTCATCVANCLGKQCGDDGCGGTCGECAEGLSCSLSGKCGVCQPNCIGKHCGDDGCGGLCGTCPAGKVCGDQFFCVADEGACQPQCVAKECGFDGCSGLCGSCPAGQTCNPHGKCVNPCIPNCDGKHCGDDGCGAQCGTCPPGKTCGPQFFCTTGGGGGAGGGAGGGGAGGGLGGLGDVIGELGGGVICSKPNDCEAGQTCCDPFGAGIGACLDQSLCPGGDGIAITVCTDASDCGEGNKECCDPVGIGLGFCIGEGQCPGGGTDDEAGAGEEGGEGGNLNNAGCAPTGAPGCDGCPCEGCVCEQDPFCCEVDWDETCVDLCAGPCQGCANSGNGNADSPGCTPTNEPGCGGCACEACVCEQDPFCCNNSWDATCADLCGSACGSCGAEQPGGIDGAGCEPSDSPGCNGCECEDCVCEIDPFCCSNSWDETCVQECTFDCDGCTETTVGSNGGCEVSPNPGCNDCECESCVCEQDDYCCTFSWDATCVGLCTECGSCEGNAENGDGATGCEPLSAPGCGGCECEDCVCGQDPFCCNNVWDDVCATQCEEDCDGCDININEEGGDTGADGCTATGTPGCDGCECEDCVCAFDAYCCQTAWDETCVQECTEECNGCGGPSEIDNNNLDGCTPSDTPGCGGCDCEQCVCSLDDYCCNNSWDDFCVDQCQNECGGCAEGSGTTGSPDGCTPSEEPGCIDCICETCVCNQDPYCCNNAWDEVCVDECTDCGGCGSDIPGSPDGCTPAEGPGCSDCSCEDCTCELDDFCCNNSWDETCVTICNEDCGGCGGNGDTTLSDGCSASGLPGCDGCGCEACVCSQDSFCCNNSWDSSCVELCVNQCGGCAQAAVSDGCNPSTAPGCDGCECETCVCNQDPFCCNNAWDEVCVDLCVSDCGGCDGANPEGGNSGATGCEALSEPGCDGCECEDCVCSFDPFCCNTIWDATCASECAEDCDGCDAPGEGGGSGVQNGCSPLETAGCNGCACESCVCDLDAYCCDTQWDDICVSSCSDDCGFCGDGSGVGSADGCSPSDGPGCGGCPCEDCVCAFDSFCCNNAWDDVCVTQCTEDCGGDCTNPGAGGGQAGDGCTPTESAGCDGCECEACVCALDPFCCNNTWDDVCVTQCTEDCSGCGGGEGGAQVSDGCTPSTEPGCDGCICEDCVCNQDAFCCVSAWDDACVSMCADTCGGCGNQGGGEGGATSDGCTPSDAPGCGGCGCETCVCTADPYCCNNSWDDVCVDQCTNDCGGCGGGVGEEGGGGAGSPDGCTPAEGPGCNGCECESCVCSFDNYCCNTAWDQTCVNECTEDCAGCGNNGEGGGGAGSPNGCTPADGPGCNGCACESCVCSQDDYCCSTQWDDICVDMCTTDCGSCGGGGEGGGNPDSCAGNCDGQAANGCWCTPDCVDFGDCCPDACAQCGACDNGGGGDPDSCAGNCDGQAANGCWCTPDCVDFGDCCPDACAQCGACDNGGGGDPNSCSGNCDGQAPGGCWCTSDCVDFGDCCPDACAQCGACDNGGGGFEDPNSCAGNCSGQASGGCWCTADCVDFGDCCPDACAQCGACDNGGGGGGFSDPNSCSGICGGQAPGGCWCDDTCANYGDCCSDACALCGACDNGGGGGGGGGGGFFGGGGGNDNSCSGNCGGEAPGGCWCDDTCADFGDCCSDACFVCGSC